MEPSRMKYRRLHVYRDLADIERHRTPTPTVLWLEEVKAIRLSDQLSVLHQDQSRRPSGFIWPSQNSHCTELVNSNSARRWWSCCSTSTNFWSRHHLCTRGWRDMEAFVSHVISENGDCTVIEACIACQHSSESENL